MLSGADAPTTEHTLASGVFELLNVTTSITTKLKFYRSYGCS